MHCQNCHGKQGEGLANLIPPLTDTLYLKKNKNNIACFIKNGMSGPVIINNKLYDGKMPSEAHLSNIEIAQVITYLTNSFGNNQGLHNLLQVNEDLKHCDTK
jgi:mono/diheme cytochrome c family protein